MVAQWFTHKYQNTNNELFLEAHLESSQTSKMELFTKIVKGFQLLTNSVKRVY